MSDLKSAGPESGPIKSSDRFDSSLSSPPSVAPPEWMLRIMHERGGQGRATSLESKRRGGGGVKLDVGTSTDESCEPQRQRITADHSCGHGQAFEQEARYRGERGDTPKLTNAEATECRDGLEFNVRGVPGGGTETCPTLPPPSSHHYEFSSASSTASTGSNSTTGFGTNRSSSSNSSSGFSSRTSAGASSVTSASSTTTFSVSSHERDRASKDRSYGIGRRRSLSGDLIVEGGHNNSAPPLGLGLYQSLTASPTLTPSRGGGRPLTGTEFIYHPSSSPLNLSPDPSRSPSFDSTLSSLSLSGGGRDATIVPSSTPALERPSSPTPSTSTLTVDADALRPHSQTPVVPVPFSSNLPPRPTSPAGSPPSIKGKEKALPVPIPPSPPRSVITLTTTTSEAGTEDLLEDDELAGQVLYPPENFAIVAPGIFRSSFPRPKNFKFLKSLGLKSVLTLIQDEYPRENVEFLAREGIELFQFPIPGNKEPFVHIPDDKIVAAMEVLLDSRNHPLLIHCNKGKHRTGCLVGVLRRLQTWSLTAIFDEYRRYSHPKSRQMDLQFIEAFKGLDRIWEVASQNRPHLPSWACTTPYSTPQRGQVPTEAKTKERSTSRAPSGRTSPVLKELTASSVKEEEDTGGGGNLLAHETS